MAIDTGNATRMPHTDPRPRTRSFWTVPNVVWAGMIIAVALILGFAVTNSWSDFNLGSQPAIEKTN